MRNGWGGGTSWEAISVVQGYETVLDQGGQTGKRAIRTVEGAGWRWIAEGLGVPEKTDRHQDGSGFSPE